MHLSSCKRDHYGVDLIVTMELHKLHGGRGLLGDKTAWVVRLFSHASKEFFSATVHGCVIGRDQLAALDKAFLEVGYDFVSRTNLVDYLTEGG